MKKLSLLIHNCEQFSASLNQRVKVLTQKEIEIELLLSKCYVKHNEESHIASLESN